LIDIRRLRHHKKCARSPLPVGGYRINKFQSVPEIQAVQLCTLRGSRYKYRAAVRGLIQTPTAHSGRRIASTADVTPIISNCPSTTIVLKCSELSTAKYQVPTDTNYSTNLALCIKTLNCVIQSRKVFTLCVHISSVRGAHAPHAPGSATAC